MATQNSGSKSGSTVRIPALDVPEPAVARHPGMFRHPRELQRWLDSVALADPAQVAEKLLWHLRLVARDPEPHTSHPGLLDAFHPPLKRLQEKVWDNFVHNRASRKPEQLLSRRTSLLLQEMAYPYMRRVNQRVAAAEAPETEDLFNAMLLLNRLIQWEVLQYQLISPQTWRQVLLLFAISECCGLSAAPNESRLSMEFDPLDIHTQFYATLVLQLADAYRLPSLALPRLVRGLGQVAGRLRSAPTGSGRHSAPVNFSGKIPPLRCARLPRQAPAVGKVVVLDDLLEYLEQHPFPGDESTGLALGAWLSDSLRELTDLSTKGDARRQPRQLRPADYRMLNGLTSIHRRLSELQSRQDETSAASDGILVEDHAYLAPVSATHHDCQQVNRSLSGARFRLPNGVPVPPIGQVVLFEAQDASDAERIQGFVAQVKRHLSGDDGSHDIGVEKISGNLVPVIMGHQHTAGLLNADRQQDQLVLFAPHGSFAANSQVLLSSPGRQYQVRHAQLLEDQLVQRIRVSLI